VGFDHPDWHSGFEHDPEEAARARLRLLRELAATGERLVATHLPFPSVGRVAADGYAFRWAPVFWTTNRPLQLGPERGGWRVRLKSLQHRRIRTDDGAQHAVV
jgi:hypothetical protein